MTTTGKDTASFFENGTTDQFEYCYQMYPQVLQLKAEKRCKKPQELIRLDQWYQYELPKLIKARGKDAHMVYDELVQTMKWKQSRGKFYPQLSYLVKVNTPRAVMQETKKAFRKLPNLEQAITALSNLKGVGTTMASALLAAAAPDSAPFMADECLMAIPEIEGIDYTTKEYLNFVQHIQSTVERLNTEVGGEEPFWSPHRVELALWSHYVANDLSPELLDKMPSPGASIGGGVKTNGSTTKITVTELTNDKAVDGAGEDTNDEESLGAAVVVARGNITAIESETDQENTNPARQDGDSNFVSNDSTSQEPNMDENTTQTTATTTSSTDGDGDGDVETGTTPLASDSESNIEAPANNNAVTANNGKKNGSGSTSSVLPTLHVDGVMVPPPTLSAASVPELSPGKKVGGKEDGIIVTSAAAALVPPQSPVPITPSATTATAPATAVGNGNGSLLPPASGGGVGGGGVSVSTGANIYGRNSCPPTVSHYVDDDDDEDDDEDDGEEDDEDDDDDEEGDEEDDEEDENTAGRLTGLDSNSRVIGDVAARVHNSSTMPIMNDNVNNTNTNTNMNMEKDTTTTTLLNSTAVLSPVAVGQKRSAVICGLDGGGGGGGGDDDNDNVGSIVVAIKADGDDANKQPESKKLRSD